MDVTPMSPIWTMTGPGAAHASEAGTDEASGDAGGGEADGNETGGEAAGGYEAGGEEAGGNEAGGGEPGAGEVGGNEAGGGGAGTLHGSLGAGSWGNVTPKTLAGHENTRKAQRAPDQDGAAPAR
ncbi:hypothetical protein [Couchioplanes azureus]|uniref:hypothetical protein n=1 Tax=Couchioplanes caeruleus TaxID=56438 RepID=UPI0016700FB4|nr:hypothetical protein [Couchioplanes caeruleus]